MALPGTSCHALLSRDRYRHDYGQMHSQIPYEDYQKLIPEVKKEYSEKKGGQSEASGNDEFNGFPAEIIGQ